jgi:hypothetical protein
MSIVSFREDGSPEVLFDGRFDHTANSSQVGGDHYQKVIQPWDYIIANDIGYMEGNIIKYISRWRDKNGVEDLRKAQHYLQKLIEVNDDNSAEEKGDCPEGTGC